MARIVVACDRRDKIERNSCATSENDRRRKLESRSNSSKCDDQTTVNVDADVEECAPDDKRRVQSKVTRLAQKFNSTSLNDGKRVEKSDSLPPPPQQRVVFRRHNADAQRYQHRASANFGPFLATREAGSDGNACRVEKAIRLFEIDSTNRRRGGEDKSSSLKPNSNAASGGGGRVMKKHESKIGKTDASAGSEKAIIDNLVSARNRLKPLKKNVRTTMDDEKREKPSPRSHSPNSLKKNVRTTMDDEKREKPSPRSHSPLSTSSIGETETKMDEKTALPAVAAPPATAVLERGGGGSGGAGDKLTNGRRCVSMRVKDTQTYASFDMKSLKNRPLSVAQHFHLESALNDATWPSTERCTRASAVTTISPSASALALNKNRSFLHRSKNYSSPSRDKSWSTVLPCGGGGGDVGGSVNGIPSSDRSCDQAPADLVDADADDLYGYSNIDELHRSGSGSSFSFLSVTTGAVSASASESCQRHRHLFDTRSSASTSATSFYDCGECDSNVYDTVLYSELTVTRRPEEQRASYGNVNANPNVAGVDGSGNRRRNRKRDDDDGAGDDDYYSSSCYSGEAAYEVVSPLAYAAVDSDSNSESSLEKANSLYETKETTTPTSNSRCRSTDSTVSSDIGLTASTQHVANECNKTDAGDGAVAAANTTNSSASVASDDWLDINEWESVDDIHRTKMIVVKKRRIHLGKLRKLKRKKFRSLQNPQKNLADSKTRGKETISGGDNFCEELCDDFDDTSSEENDDSLRSSHHSPSCTVRAPEKTFLPNVQTQNIYEFMKKARKTVRKSWSSLNQQMRRSSSNSGLAATNAGAGDTGSPSKGIAVDAQWSESNARANGGGGAFMKCRNNRGGGGGGGGGAATASGGSVRWTSFKTKLRPKYGTVSAANSSSIFYLNPEDLRFDKATSKTDGHADVRVSSHEKSTCRRRRTTCADLNPTRTRPSSPPPPPPVLVVASAVDKRQREGEVNDHDVDVDADHHNQNNVGTGATTYASRSLPSSSNSDLNLSSCSDLRLRFADEPLYQFYAESVAQLTTNASMLQENSDDSDGYEEIGSLTSRPSAMELITPSPNGHGQCRSLWCEVDEVKNSGIPEKLSISRQKLQEAKFEVITSEASYYKSLSVLDRIFVSDSRLRDENLLCKNDWKILFGNVATVRKCSQALLSDLETCWQKDIMLAGLSDVIHEHASTNFKIFIKYCSNQIYIDRTLKKLREESVSFVELISKLEADPVCQSLSLHSFLMLPMQRITRMPLLVDAILSKLDPIDDQSDYRTFKTTLAKLNKIVKECNENARKFERYEEMLLVSRQLEFSRKDVKMFSVASSSRWLVRSGPLLYLNPPDAKLTITRKLTKNEIKLYFFLFNDILVIAKKKSEDSYAVVDYCLRNVMQISSLEETHSSSSMPSLVNLYLPHRYLLMLTILENHEGKTVEMVLSCDSDSTRQRWLEASYSRLTSDNPEEKLYEEWDCPQVLTVHAYVANQPDELSLQNGDVVKVLKKTTDGWYHGERIRDGVIGWFPGNYTIEIASQHTRAKNLKLRHRLLTLSADYLQNQLLK